LIIIYTPKVTNRIRYTLDFVFTQYFGIEYQITDDFSFVSHSAFSINYSDVKVEGCYNIYQSPLLLESHICAQHIFVTRESIFNNEEESIPVFFQSTDHFDLKYDVFAAIFYLLSRYEEYLPHEKDEHGRYRSSNSILSNPQFKFCPIIETWLSDLKNRLLSLNASLSFKEYKFEYMPTFDIDNAYKYSGRDWRKHPPNIFDAECRAVLRKKIKDPYDTYEFMLTDLVKSGHEATFFFLMSDDSEFNSNVSPHAEKLKTLIDAIKDKTKIGIHFSYFAETKNLLGKEKRELEKNTSEITISRQHFLRINFPLYYRQLIATGIKKDYSLMYPDVSGFRAGFSREFYFFDLERNETTHLILQPGCWMDATFQYYQTKKYEEIEQDFLTLFSQIKKNSGKLVTLFHNDLSAIDKFRRMFMFINQQVNSGK
jgi:hypothetical protein